MAVASKKPNKGIEQTNKAKGKAIRQLRKLRGVSAKTMAEAARCDRETLRRMEAGDEEIRPKTLERIARKLKVPVNCLEIMGYDPGEKKDSLEGRFLASIQELVTVTVKAQTKLTKAK